jgi:ATP-dependent DNA helicase DinG
VRRARQAEIVIANHALVMMQAATAPDARELPTRYVFDEGHHVFDAADGIFSALLSGQETAELRRWVRGAEPGQRGGGRMRGLQRRLGDLAAGDEVAEQALRQAIQAAAALPAEGWLTRIAEGLPHGPTEEFLGLVRAHVLARAPNPRSPHGLEAEPVPPIPGLVEAGLALDAALEKLARPLAELARAFAARLDDEAAELDTGTRVRLEAAARGLERRAGQTLAAWRSMLQGLDRATPPEFVDWMSIERIGGRDVDVGLHRHHVDPTRPFAEAVLERAHGVLVTSATLRDRTPGPGDDWASAELRTGVQHLLLPARRVTVASPFDYPARTRVLIVTDVRRDEPDEVAAAYRELFLAAGGGAIGLFTAIERLRAVHRRIAPALEAAGIDLLAQHVDGIDTGTLVDIFRAEPDSCLLGTDAVRDGVDVPGRALRLIVFDRVPWPRPDILHKARKAAFGGSVYDDMIARLKLKQAFGRLVRKEGDEGVFVMLDAMTPSRLLSAFPEGVAVTRVGLAEAVQETRAFLAQED